MRLHITVLTVILKRQMVVKRLPEKVENKPHVGTPPAEIKTFLLICFYFEAFPNRNITPSVCFKIIKVFNLSNIFFQDKLITLKRVTLVVT